MTKGVCVFILVVSVVAPRFSYGQVGGNVTYSGAGGRASAEQAERNKRVLTDNDLPPSDDSMFIEANVLMNVKADEYVATFGIAHEAESAAECGQKMEATVKELSDGLKPLGVGGDDVFVDFVAQNKIYGLELKGDIAHEKLVGFELKKNISIHYKDRALLDKLVIVAARSQVFDLIKVDSLVKDARRVRDKLMEEAAGVLKHKASRYETLLGIKLRGPAQVYAERSAVHDPTWLYDSYTAHESEQMTNAAYRQKYTTQSARKTKTSFFNGLDADGFDEVINPVVIEPVVQFTLYLKVKYELDRPNKKE